MQIEIIQGDITRQDVDAIVNAANTGMLGGGGVDGAIHEAAGPALLEACRQLPRRDGMRCRPGEAVLLPGGELPARHVIGTVGPIYASDPDPPATLARAHRSSLELAVEHRLASVAFPAISCGAYGYPLAEAATVALSVAREREWSLELVRFVLFSADVLDAFQRVADRE